MKSCQDITIYLPQPKDVDELAKKYKLDSDAHQRLHEFYHHKYGGEIHEDEEIIKELSLALKIVQEIGVH